MNAQLTGELSRFDIYIVEDLQVVGDEADRADEDGALALLHERAHLLQDVRPQPGLGCAPGALEGEVPAALGQPQISGDGARRRQQLALIGIVPLADALRQAVRREEDEDARALLRSE